MARTKKAIKAKNKLKPDKKTAGETGEMNRMKDNMNLRADVIPEGRHHDREGMPPEIPLDDATGSPLFTTAL